MPHAIRAPAEASPDAKGIAPADIWYDAVAPEVSIVILCLDKPELTKDCLRHIWSGTYGRRYEIVVVDNGSTPENFRNLAEFEGRFGLVRLATNRYFGEGNNIGAERAKGRYLVFLNNDAFVTDGWLWPLIDLLEREPDAGGVGPRFLYPDGRLQEAGAYVDETGRSIQVGKCGIYDAADLVRTRVVDYCSAACLAVPRDLFERVAGFDLVYEPAYYEDCDLCFKIASLGKRIYYCPESTIVHVENATAAENCEALGLDSMVEINRQRFLSRWGDWLTARAENRDAPLPRHLPSWTVASATRDRAVVPNSKVVFYSPYNLVPGGGERYVLSAAAALSPTHDVYVATEEAYSRLRLAALGRELALDLSGVTLVKRSEVQSLGAVECSIQMANEVLPPFPGFGRRNIYVCQFPFPIADCHVAHRWTNLDGIDEVVVYSRFVEENLQHQLQKLNLGPKPIRIVAPPVALIPDANSPRRFETPFRIVLIGRFYAGGHNKRHDVAIEAARALVARGVPVELHLAGSLHIQPVHRVHYEGLRKQADGLPVAFHPNASRGTIESLLRGCRLYWHATGFEVDPAAHPERCEHFGISILEAMSAGAVPFVCANGGPLEFVEDGRNGVVYDTIDELVDGSHRLLADPDLCRSMAENGRRTASDFAEAVFAAQWRMLIGTAG